MVKRRRRGSLESFITDSYDNNNVIKSLIDCTRARCYYALLSYLRTVRPVRYLRYTRYKTYSVRNINVPSAARVHTRV